MIRTRALLARQQNPAAEQAAKEIIAQSDDFGFRLTAEMILVRIQLLLGKRDLADTMLTALANKDGAAEIKGGIAVLRGDIAFARKNFEAALESYLQVPAFYGSDDELMPVALLGSARAFRGYGDSARAERAYLDLIATFPASAEAAIAKREVAGP